MDVAALARELALGGDVGSRVEEVVRVGGAEVVAVGEAKVEDR